MLNSIVELRGTTIFQKGQISFTDLGYASTASTVVEAFLDGVDANAQMAYFMRGGADTDTGNKNNKTNAPVSIPNEVDITVKVLGGNPGDGKVWQVQIWYTVD